MSNHFIIKDFVADMLKANGLGVLATEGNGQPHASLVAITPMDDFVHLIFATYRNTLKYKNLIINRKVAILFDNRSDIGYKPQDITVITAFGIARELNSADFELVFQAHLLRHPEFELFMLSDDCALFQVKVDAYQIVRGIDDITWWNIDHHSNNEDWKS